MLRQTLTRRRFLAGCAGATACALIGANAGAAYASGGDIGPDARPSYETANTVCAACPAGCAFTAYVVDGKLGKVIGNGADPNARGTLCARGYAFTQSAFLPENVKSPLMRKEDGSFEAVSWEKALEGIAADMKDIIERRDPKAVAAIYNAASPVASAYAPRFMAALGCDNAFANDVTYNVNKEAAFSQAIGMGSYVPDYDNASLILLVDTSYADIVTPSIARALQAARESGTPIIAIDSRLGDVASFADEWIGVNAGSELALLLAVCNELVRTSRYDAGFVASNATGFDEWATVIAGYTPQWAEDITGVQSFRIEQLATQIAQAAPAVAVEYGNGHIGAATFVNSSETARAVCMLNMLTGSWNATGGALLPFDLAQTSLDAVMGPVADDADLPRVGAPSFPLGRKFGASAANALRECDGGSIQALISIDTDIAYDYASLQDIEKVLEEMDLFVCITRQMTKTASVADYVLPLADSLQSSSLPVFTADAAVASVAAVTQVMEQDESSALPLSVIMQRLAEACDIGHAFPFTEEEAASAQLQAVGLDLDGLQIAGCSEISPDKAPRQGNWSTPSGKIQCVSPACADAGQPASPVWVPTIGRSDIDVVASEDMNFGVSNRDIIGASMLSRHLTFHLITGQRTVMGSEGYDVPELTDIAAMYGLDGVWINASIARMLGIQTGDTVIVSNGNAKYSGRAFVTQRIVPTAVYLPAGFGHQSKDQAAGSEMGVNPYVFSSPVIEDGYGTLCTQEAVVRLTKGGE